MADEMSDDSENDAEFLEYKLCSFQSDFQLDKIRNIVLCTRNRLLVIHYGDGKLSIVRAGNYDQELKAESDVREIYYHDDDNSLTTLCLLHNNGNLSVYALEDNLRCIASWNELALSTVLSAQGLVLPNTSTLPFVLGCTRSRLLVLAQEEDGRLLTPAEEQPTNDVSGATNTTEPPAAGRVASLLLSSKSTGKLECGYTIALPTYFEDCHVLPSVQLHQSTLSILDWAQHALYLYDIEDGTCFLQVNLHSIVHLCSSMPKFWRVSNDDTQLFLISEINSAICFSLRDLYSFRPEDCKFSFPSTDLPQTAEHRKWSRIHKYGYCIPMIQKDKSSALNPSSAEKSAKKRVSGLKKCLPSVTLDDKIKVMQLPEFLEQHHATDIAISPTVGKVLFTSEEGVNAVVLWMCDFMTGNVRLKRFKKGSGLVVLGMEQCHPPLILREGGLYAMVDGLLQEEFIDKVMIYGGARVTDELCQMNKWGRCSLPLRALELGLKYRQLDTISVFLRTRQNIFSNKNLDGTQTDSTDQSSDEGNGHLFSLRQLEPAYQILLRSIEENMAEQQSLFFAQQLLGVMLNHLYCLLNDALSVQNLQPDNIPDDEQDETDQAMDIVMDYISNVRSYMTTLGQKRQNTVDEDDVPSGMNHSIVSIDQESSSNWPDMDVMDAIEDGIRRNIVPVVQDYLLQQNLPHLAQLSEVFRLGLLRSIEYLQRGQFDDASLLISNLGFSPNEKYWSFAQYTNDHALRDCILNYLSKTGEEKEIVTYFCKLQEAYNCASFERVKENLLPLSGWKGLDPVAACMTISASQYDLRSSCGEISPDQQHIPASLNNNRYCDVLLDWLLSWSTDAQQLVLLDAQMTSQSCSVQYPDIPNHVMWEYLVSHNRIDAALNWLSEHITLKKDDDSPDDTLSYQQILHTVKTSATSYLRELIYMQLARNGILDSSVPTGKFGRFLQLLCQLGGVLKIPSPVSHIDNIYIELHHFHQDFIAYCTENRFGYLLWKYCEKNQITPKQLSLQLFDDQHIMWIKMFQNFYSLSLNPYDISPMYEASLANAGVVWNLHESTVAGLVQQGHVLAALATTLYGNDLLTSMTSSLGVPDPFQGIDMDTLEDSLLQFPRLHDALFPTSIKKASQYDITVYQLLRGNSPFDPARLFGWHSTNTVAGEDSLKVMPHFSLPELMSKYAQQEGIQFTYYLRQGRPTFAFCSFVSEEFTHGTVLASHRIQAACWIATKIGVKSFYQPQIAASCSAFIEMLGGNSILLRLLVDVGNKVVTHKNAKLMSWGGGIQWRKDYCKQHEEETGRLLMACFKQRGDCASELLHQLEDAIMLKLEEEDISPFSFEAGHMWTISVLLCIQLHLPYPTKYLEICASTNNWLPFLWFAQLHQYPKEQLHQMVSWFPNSHLRDHIFYVLNNAQNRFLAELAMPPAGDDTKRPRSFRSGFYSRLGMSKSLDTTQSSSDEEEDTLSLASFKNENKDTDLEFELKSESAADDVFRVIFSAQATKSVWKSLLAHGIALRNPLFTELAACQKDSNILSCLCGWLLSVMDPPRHTQFLNQHSHIVTKWNLDHLRELLEIFLNNNWISNLATGFAIFQMDTPLALFLKFLSCCLEKHNYSECHSLLEQFKHSLLSKPKGERISVSQMPPSFCMIGDLHWQEHTCQCLVRHLLASLLNIYDILQLLKYLHHCNIASVFTSLPGLNYGQLLKVAQILHENQLSISFHLFLVSDQKLLTSQLEPLVTNIVSKKLYDPARMLCEFAKISHEDVTMKEVVNEKEELQKSHAWLSELVRINFWKDCLNKFTEHGVSPMKIVQFYLNEIKKCQNGSSNMNEQAIMYELCVKSLLDAPDPSGNLYANTVNELTHKMWYCRIMARVPKIERIPSLVAPIDEMFVGLEEIPPSHLKTSALKTELLQHGKMPNISQKPSEFSDSEQRALSLLIGELLDEARLSDCCRIAAEFYFYSQDLAIILTCIRLSIGSISVDEIVPEIKQLLSQSADINMNTTTGFSRQLSNGASLFRLSNASLGSLTGVGNLTLTPEQEQKITIMEQLYGLCVQGKQCCRRVLTAKKIALVLGRKYEFVITSDEFTILEMLLKVENSVRFHLAKEFLATSTVTDTQLAGFLADAILKSLKICAAELRSPDSNSPTAVEHDLIFNPIGPAGGDSQQFLQLCQDPSRLGDRLLDAVASLASDTNPDVLTVQTQLLILAHRCHTAACNMEGISNVLRAARVLNQCLSQAEEFPLMIQLLTGVGRFNEMTYIFDALKQHHQFELLLRKGMEKEDQLKVAILDYLKRFHANDSDSYTMVAINFTMFREIGQMLEELAQKNLVILKRKPLVNSAEVETTLHKIHQYFSDAAESYMKDNILRHAEYCVRQARLVKLQLDLLSSGIHVINLTPEDAVNFIIQHPKFSEALVVSEAYNKTAVWGEALCNRLIIHGDFRYLQDLKAYIRLNPALIIDTIDRYKQLPHKPSQCEGNLKKLLLYCKDLRLQYQIARELGLKDFLSQLETGHNSAYIMDIAASRGSAHFAF